MAQAFDGRSQLTGDAIPDRRGRRQYLAATAGFPRRPPALWRSGPAASAATIELLWFDRQGKRLGQLGPRLDYGSIGVQLSPDGKRVVVDRGRAELLSGVLGAIQSARVVDRRALARRSSVV